MSKLIYRTVKFIKQECDEAWKKEHREVMRNYRNADCLDECAQLLAGVYDQIKAKSESDLDNFDTVVTLCDALDLWYEVAGGLLSEIEESEVADFTVATAVRIRDCHRDASHLVKDLHDAKNAIEAARSGRTKGLEEFLDELRHKVPA